MPNLQDLIKDVQAFYGLPTPEASAFADRLTPVVILQNADAPFAVVRNDRSTWSAQAGQLGVASHKSMVWLFNPAKSGVDVVITEAFVTPGATGNIRIGRLPGNADGGTVLGTATSVAGDPRNPNGSLAQMNTGHPEPVFVGSNLSFVFVGVWEPLSVPQLIEPNNSWGVEFQGLGLDFDMMLQWEERTQLTR